MGKQPKIHTIYTLQVKANGTQQFSQATLDDMLESINETIKSWFPKGEVELAKYDATAGDKRVVITNVFSTRTRGARNANMVNEINTNGRSVAQTLAEEN